MNFEFFISKRLITEKDYKSSISAPIIKIATLAISLGIVMMLIAFGTGLGLQEKIRDKIAAFNGHITVSPFSSNQSDVTLTPVSKDQEFYPDFNSVNNIEHIQVIATKYGIIRTETDFEGIVVKGVEADYKWTYFQEYLKEGRLPDYTDEISREILISEYIAKRMKFELGDQVVVYFLQDRASKKPRLVAFDIVGIFNSGFLEFDESFLIADLKQIQRLNKWEADQVGGFEIFVDDFNNIEAVGNTVYTQIGSFLNSDTIVEMYPAIFEWLSLFDFNIALIIGIMILVAGINMITALLVLILERTTMIGMLKSLGANNWSIRKIFLYNAAFLMLKGMFWGNLIGVGFLVIQKYFKIIPLDPATYYVTEAPVYLSWTYILGVNIGTFILCLVMLIIPSIIIARISPVKALKFD
ncbi:MAG: ABC transporter permease [Bacteroidota bacterium]